MQLEHNKMEYNLKLYFVQSNYVEGTRINGWRGGLISGGAYNRGGGGIKSAFPVFNFVLWTLANSNSTSPTWPAWKKEKPNKSTVYYGWLEAFSKMN